MALLEVHVGDPVVAAGHLAGHLHVVGVAGREAQRGEVLLEIRARRLHGTALGPRRRGRQSETQDGRCAEHP